MKIEFANLEAQYKAYEHEIDQAVKEVLASGQYIMGKQVGEFEQALSDFTGAPYAIGCASGTDALQLALMAIDIKPGDEVITTPFTFIATAEIITLLGAIPVFVDIDPVTYNIAPSKIAEKMTAKTRAIMPVALYGLPADMDEINIIAKEAEKRFGNKVYVIEDAAQSFGATYKGKFSCNLSELACTSFFPAKPLGCAGDGGAVFTSNKDLADKMKAIRVHGQTKRYHHDFIGFNARLDTLQAAILQIKLKHFANEVNERQAIAKRYDAFFAGKDIPTPVINNDRTSVYAQYTIRVKNRAALQEQLTAKGIPTAVHYPKPLHMQPCFQYLGYQLGSFPIAEQAAAEVMSLPMSAFLTKEQQEYICKQFELIANEAIA